MKIPPYRVFHDEFHGRNEKVTGLRKRWLIRGKRNKEDDLFEAILRGSKVLCLKPPKLMPDPNK